MPLPPALIFVGAEIRRDRTSPGMGFASRAYVHHGKNRHVGRKWTDYGQQHKHG